MFRSMSYFVPGLWHFAAAMAFACALGTLHGGDLLFWLRRAEFVLGLLVLGPASHRHWLTHSPFLAVGAAALGWKYPVLLDAKMPFAWLGAGLCVGLGSHLFWDCISSRSHKIVFVPYWFALRPAMSRVYLLLGATMCLGIGTALATGGAQTFSRHAKNGLPSTSSLIRVLESGAWKTQIEQWRREN
jgi:membrane-bound metal-dependent hydrolase YbcI (DUF457 family)